MMSVITTTNNWRRRRNEKIRESTLFNKLREESKNSVVWTHNEKRINK